jgi:DNA polymerase III subunit epsilon
MNQLTFTAIDTETATNDPASICQIGIVVVENGQIVLERSYLVQPPGNEYKSLHSSIHGIDALRTKEQPTFPAIWEKIESFLINNLLVAHNAAFDLKVLNSALDYYNIPKPVFTCDCTFRITGLNLKALSQSFKIDMTKHHDALSDARTCALAYISLKQGIKPDHSLITESKPSNVFAGHEQLKGSVLKPSMDIENRDNPFYSKKVVFTGVLQTITREDAARKIQQMGADIDTGVSIRTDYVIVGLGAGPSKLKKIAALNSTGSKIRILEEAEFLSMLEKVSPPL